MEMMDIKKLKPHPKNRYFFDDIEGEPWVAFLDSIKTSGIIEPIIATQDLVIVSGHQRVRAAEKLGIEKVAVEVRVFDSDDEVIKQLIETNIMQRGVGNTNAVKLGRCIAELERIYGIKNGNNQHTEKSLGHNVQPTTQSDLAEQLDISVKQLNRYKSLTDLIPELQDAIQSGQITATTAMGVVKKLSPEEQEQLAEQIRGKGKVTSQEIKFYKDRIQKLSDENAELRRQPMAIKERTIEVIPDDYEQLKSSLKSAEKERQQYANEILEAKKRIRELETPSNDEKIVDEAKDQMDNFSIATYNYIRKYGGFVWAFDKWGDIPEETRKNFTNAITALNGFVQQMEINMKGVK